MCASIITHPAADSRCIKTTRAVCARAHALFQPAGRPASEGGQVRRAKRANRSRLGGTISVCERAAGSFPLSGSPSERPTD